MSRINFFFAWYDAWIGLYWHRDDRQLYICPLPFCVFKIDLRRFYIILGTSEKYRNRAVGTTVGPTDIDPCRLVEIPKSEWLERRRRSRESASSDDCPSCNGMGCGMCNHEGTEKAFDVVQEITEQSRQV